MGFFLLSSHPKNGFWNGRFRPCCSWRPCVPSSASCCPGAFWLWGLKASWLSPMLQGRSIGINQPTSVFLQFKFSHFAILCLKYPPKNILSFCPLHLYHNCQTYFCNIPPKNFYHFRLFGGGTIDIHHSLLILSPPIVVVLGCPPFHIVSDTLLLAKRFPFSEMVNLDVSFMMFHAMTTRVR